ENVLRTTVERDDGRLVEDDPLSARVDERVRRTEIDREVARQGAALLGRPASARRRFGCECAQTALELLDAVLHRARSSVAQQDGSDADRAGGDGEQQERHGRSYASRGAAAAVMG